MSLKCAAKLANVIAKLETLGNRFKSSAEAEVVTYVTKTRQEGSGLSLLTFVHANLEVGTPGRTRTCDPLLRSQIRAKLKCAIFLQAL